MTVTDERTVPVSELSYTEASGELDRIVAFFEQRDVDVDLLVDRLERATAIVDELDRRLRRTRVQVEQLVPRLEAAAGAAADEVVARPDEGTGADEWGEIVELADDDDDDVSQVADDDEPPGLF